MIFQDWNKIDVIYLIKPERSRLQWEKYNDCLQVTMTIHMRYSRDMVMTDFKLIKLSNHNFKYSTLNRALNCADFF